MTPLVMWFLCAELPEQPFRLDGFERVVTEPAVLSATFDLADGPRGHRYSAAIGCLRALKTHLAQEHRDAAA